MQRYEHKCVFIWGLGASTTRALNQYGRDGWKLVAVSWCWHYFTRPLEM